jgi:hypothetical protein
VRPSADTHPGNVPGPHRVLFVFLDGIGLAPEGPDNPFGQVPMPRLESLLGGPLVLDGRLGRLGESVLFRALDANLGVPGLPQSATGQTALFTGVNAPQAVGDHVTAHPTAPLREIIARESVLKRAAEARARVLFANAHSRRFWEMVEKSRRRMGASTLTALAAGAPIPDLEDLARGEAVMWDITHEIANHYLELELPLVAPPEAGRRLARLADAYDLVLFESFLPDLAGHRRLEPEWVLSRLDGLLGGILDHRSPEVTLLVSSDHGNLEDVTTKAHTANPVPLLAVGPAATFFQEAESIMAVAPAILAALGLEPAA